MWNGKMAKKNTYSREKKKLKNLKNEKTINLIMKQTEKINKNTTDGGN